MMKELANAASHPRPSSSRCSLRSTGGFQADSLAQSLPQVSGPRVSLRAYSGLGGHSVGNMTYSLSSGPLPPTSPDAPLEAAGRARGSLAHYGLHEGGKHQRVLCWDSLILRVSRGSGQCLLPLLSPALFIRPRVQPGCDLLSATCPFSLLCTHPLTARPTSWPAGSYHRAPAFVETISKEQQARATPCP